VPDQSPEDNSPERAQDLSETPNQDSGDGDESLSPEILEKVAQNPQIAAQVVKKQISGPLPPSSEFEQYERTLPGGADRILRMAEEQSAHRREIEKSDSESARKLNDRGQWIGAGLLVFIVLCATVGGIFGGPAVSFAVTSPGIILLIVFGLSVYRR